MTPTAAAAYARADSAHDRLDEHEDRCKERHDAIRRQLSALFRLAWAIAGGVVMLLLAVLGWCAVALYGLQTARLPPLGERSMAAATAAPVGPPRVGPQGLEQKPAFTIG